MASTTSSTARGYGATHRRQRLLVLARDGYRCHWCGRPATHCDHLDPLAERDRSIPTPLDRLVASCAACNLSRGGQLGATRRALHPSRRW